MSFKARYVTVCQQLLVTAVVLAMGVTAAGVLRLDIVTPSPTSSADAPLQPGGQQPGAVPAPVPAPTEHKVKARAPQPVADPAPAVEHAVTPKVREVKVEAEQPQPRESDSAKAVSPRVDPAVTRGVDKGKVLAAVSQPEKVTGYATVGVTWKSGIHIPDDDLTIQVRSLKNGKWSDWAEADYHDDHGPDAGSAEAAGVRPGTDALVIGDVDEVQMRAETTDGIAPPDLQLALVDPGLGKTVPQEPAIDTSKLAADAGPVESTSKSAYPTADPVPGEVPSSDGPIALSAMKVTAKPTIYSRAQWGANEKMRDARSLHYGTVKAGFVHHTVNANNYTAAQVPALIRGIYAYHTQSRGWSDIGYNFLVDRFGRIWEGRYGGVTRNPVGAHTLGYNDVSFAMSAIGNFDIARPPAAMLAAYGKLMAWKLSLSNISATATRINLHGKYFNAINGHRDAGKTACPGRYLYAQLPNIRAQAAAIQKAAQGYDPAATPAAAITQPAVSAPVPGHNLVGSATPDVVTVGPDGVLRTLRTGMPTAFTRPATVSSRWTAFKRYYLVGDVDRDGRADFLVQRADGKAAIYSARASKRPPQLAGVRGSGTWLFKGFGKMAGVGDLTGDGLADVVARRAGSGYLYVFPGNGRGKFAAPKLVSKTIVKNAVALHTAGNITGSGRPDLVLVDRAGVPRVAAGLSRGRFATPVALPRVAGAALIGIGDLDADGRADLVFAKGTTLYAHRGQGAGRFQKAVYGPVAGPAGVARRIVVNLAGNGATDVFGVNSSGRPVVVTHNGQRGVVSAIKSAQRVPATSAILNVGDWNHDGKNDIITRHENGNLLVLRVGLGNGTFANGIVMSRGWASVSDLTAVGDVTGDGLPDLAGRIGTTPMRIFPSNGRAGVQPPRWAPKLLTTYGQIGVDAWRTYEMPNSAYRSTSGTVVPVGGASPSASLRARMVNPAAYDLVTGIGDFDGDRSADLVARQRGTGVLWLLRANREGTVISRTFLGSGYGSYWTLG